MEVFDTIQIIPEIYDSKFLQNALSLNSDWTDKLWPFSDEDFDNFFKNWKHYRNITGKGFNLL